MSVRHFTGRFSYTQKGDNMKTRKEIYGKEAAELLRDIATYHFIRHDQFLKLYPGRKDRKSAYLLCTARTHFFR